MSGISNAPGTQATSICASSMPYFASTSNAPLSNRPVIVSLYRDTTIAKRPSVDFGWPSKIFGMAPPSAFHAHQKLRVALRLLQPRRKQLHGIGRIHVVKHPAEDGCAAILV